MKRRGHNEAAFVLHAYPYMETSLVVEVLTRGHGRMGMLARGARRPRSALRGVLLAFHPLRVSWSGAAELVTLTAAEWAGAGGLSGTALMCGFYLNELLLKLLPREDAHEALFDAYGASLARLATGEPHAAVLRSFERRLLTELGYAPQLEREVACGMPIEPGRRYAYEPDRGPLEEAPGNAEGLLVSGRTLLAMARDDYREPQTREEARRLLRLLIGARLGGQVLNTRAVLAELRIL